MIKYNLKIQNYYSGTNKLQIFGTFGRLNREFLNPAYGMSNSDVTCEGKMLDLFNKNNLKFC